MKESIQKLDIIKRYNNSPDAVKASIALLFANLVLKGLSFISEPIFTRIMPTEQYGIVSTFTSWESLLSVIFTLNLSAGVFNNGMLDYKDDRDVFQYSLLIVSSFVSLVGFVIFFFFKTSLLELFDLPLRAVCLMFLKFLFFPAFLYWSGRQRYEFKYITLSVITIVSAFLSMLLGIVWVIKVQANEAAIARITAMESVSIFIGVVFFVLLGIRARFRFNGTYCLYALRFNVPLVPHYLSIFILSSSDRIMITKIIDKSATAIYSVAYTVAAVITIVWQSIEASLAPWIYEKLSANQKTPVKKLTTGVIILFAGISISCTLLAPEIMRILAPDSYSSGIYVIPPVSTGVLFTAMYSLYMRIELFYKRTGFATVASIIAALSNIVLNLVFIKSFGAIAAGYTTMICYAMLFVLHYLNVKKKGYSSIMDNKAFFGISFIVIIIEVIISFLYPYRMIRISIISVIIIIAIIYRKQIKALVKPK